MTDNDKPNMTTLTKTLLGLSAAGFAAGFTTDWLWGFAKPAGAIFLGLFLISKMLEKEIAKFDAEETKRLSLADDVSAAMTRPHERHHEERFRAAA